MGFKEFLNEGTYVLVDKDGKYLTAKNNKISFTDNVNFAYVFKSEKEAIEWEDKNGNLFDELTYVKKL